MVKTGPKAIQWASLLQILGDISLRNHGIYTFKDYLKVLKAMNFISGMSLSAIEEELVTRSWHMISFYQHYNIVTSEANIRTFILGVIGLESSQL